MEFYTFLHHFFFLSEPDIDVSKQAWTLENLGFTFIFEMKGK